MNDACHNHEKYQVQYEIIRNYLYHYVTYKILYINKDIFGSNNKFCSMTSNSHLYMAIVEWCKLFGSERGEKTFCTKSFNDESEKKLFFDSLYLELRIDKSEWEKYVDSMKIIRDKHIAHTDNNTEGDLVPKLDIAYKCIMFFNNWCKDRILDRDNIFYYEDIDNEIYRYNEELYKIILELSKSKTILKM